MNALTLEETALKEEMKERCLAKGQYIDENAKAKFKMLCHLEDFEVQYYELLKENQELKKQLEEYKEQVHKGLYNVCLPYKTGYNKAIKDKEIQQKEFIKWLEDYLNLFDNMDIDEQISYDTIEEILQKYKEIIGRDK